MWFIIQTVTSGENKSIAFLKEHYPEVISDYYFPLGRKIYRNEEGSEKVRFMPLLSGLWSETFPITAISNTWDMISIGTPERR